MRIKLFGLLLCCLLLPFLAAAQKTDTSGAAALFEKLMSGINPKHVSWVKSSADIVNEQKMTGKEVKDMSSRYANLGSLNTDDIEALAFLVLMQAVKDAQEDLKSIMANVKKINDQKKKIREALEKMNEKDAIITRLVLDSFTILLAKNPQVNTFQPSASNEITKAELEYLKNNLKNELDSLSELGEMESLRLQMAMDRMSKMLSTLSNMLRKIHRTAEEIIKNLK